jgi:hypothetical protein
VGDPRPRAPIAIWALVASIALGLLSMPGLVWAALVPAFLLAIWALFRIRPQERRGQGMAIAALVISLMAGSCSFIGARAITAGSEHVGSAILAALGSDEPTRLDGWLTEAAAKDGTAERIRKRYAATVEAVGPYQGEVGSGSILLGVVPTFVAPADVQEIGGGEGEAWPPSAVPLWVTARFRDATLHLGILLGDDKLESLPEFSKEAGVKRLVKDVRFYRPGK